MLSRKENRREQDRYRDMLFFSSHFWCIYSQCLCCCKRTRYWRGLSGLP